MRRLTRRPRRSIPFAGLLLLPAALHSVAGCAKRPPGLPADLQVEVFAIPWENAFPSDAAVDDWGRLWFTDRVAHVIGRLDPETGTFARYPVPTPKSAPYGLVRGGDGLLWFAESRGGRLGRVDPRSGEVVEYPLPGLELGPTLLAWSGERVWFTARDDRAWGWLDPRTGAVEVRPAPTIVDTLRQARPVTVNPYAIAPAPGGGAWLGGYDAALLFRARPGVDTLERHDLVRPRPAGTRPRSFGIPDSVAALQREEEREALHRSQQRAALEFFTVRRAAGDRRGGIWMTTTGRGAVAHFEPGTNALTLYPELESSGPYGIGVDAQGRVWYHGQARRRLTVIDPRTGARTLIPMPVPGAVRHIAFDDRRARVWLPISDHGSIGLIRLRR